MVALVRIKGATGQRGLELRLRDLGKIWVSSFGPWEPAAAKQHLTLAKGRTRHPQPLRPSSRSRAPERKVDARAKKEERQCSVCEGRARTCGGESASETPR
eukprot:scaffold92016_cov54-Phaeocystis_antarctica.AAC.1